MTGDRLGLPQRYFNITISASSERKGSKIENLDIMGARTGREYSKSRKTERLGHFRRKNWK